MKISIDCSKPDSIPALDGFVDSIKKRTVRGVIPGEALSGGDPDAMLRVVTLEHHAARSAGTERRAGDCVVLMGVKGEVYPVDKQKFAKTYEAAMPGESAPPLPKEPAMEGYQASVEVLGTGRKFGPGELHAMARPCASRQGPVVQVRQIREGEDVEVRPAWDPDPAHALKGKPGDWISCYGPGDYAIIEQKIFEETYQRLDAPSASEAACQTMAMDFLKGAGQSVLKQKAAAEGPSLQR